MLIKLIVQAFLETVDTKSYVAGFVKRQNVVIIRFVFVLQMTNELPISVKTQIMNNNQIIVDEYSNKIARFVQP